MEKKMEFYPGELVRLKSGGPTMTVKGYAKLGDYILCNWFGRTQLREGAFPSECLERVGEGQEGSK